MAKSPDAFRTISEVAEWLETQPHVLRFWESKFTQVKPVKRAGGRRYYRPADMLLLGGIKKLLHEDGMTIKGVQKILREQGIKHVSALSQALDAESEEALADDMSSLAGLAMSQAPQDIQPDTGTILPFQGRGDRDDGPAASAAAAAPQPPAAPPVPEPAPPEQATGPETAADTGGPVGEEDLPAFIRRSVSPETAPPESPTEPEPDPEVDAPRPRIISLPDDAEDTDPAPAGILSDIARGGPLAPGSLGEIAGLLDRLDAWRSDQARHRTE